MKNGEIDHTKNKDLPVCPKCGKHGKRTRYNDGASLFVHTSVVCTQPFPHNLVQESCYIKPGELPTI